MKFVLEKYQKKMKKTLFSLQEKFKKEKGERGNYILKFVRDLFIIVVEPSLEGLLNFFFK